MLAFICAQCGQTSFDFAEVLRPGRYCIKCKRCGLKFIGEVKGRDRQDNDVNASRGPIPGRQT